MTNKLETIPTPRRLLDVLRFWLERANERSESGDITELVELRALLAAPVVERQEPVVCAHGIRSPHACDKCEEQNAVPDYWEDPDTGTCIDQWSKIQGLNGTEAYSVPLYRHAEQPAPVAVVSDRPDAIIESNT